MKTKMFLFGLLLLVMMQVHAQTRQVTGKVLDATSREPLPGATISTIGKGTAGNTSATGDFTLSIEGKVILVVSNVGYKSQSITANIADSVFTVLLEKEETLLDQVVVIGYGKQKKKDITSSISSISGKEIKEMPVTNINMALQARIPGMQINSAGHQPGAGTNARIRGINSITQGTGPIYVVDGVIVTYDLREINPNDVESIDVLKDASAAAIYGARAAEGVVIITTKKASAGRTSVNYDGYYGAQKIIKGYDFIDNIDDYVHLRRLGWNDEDPAAWPIGDPAVDAQIFSSAELQSIQDRKWHNWEKEITQTAPMQSHSVSLSNGVGKNKFYLSGNYLNQEGIIKGSDFLRYGVKANMESEVNSKMKVGINTNFTHLKNNIVSNEAYYSALTMSPLLPIYGADGKPLANIDPSSGTIVYNNPVTLTRSPIEKVDDRLIANVFGEYRIIKNLQFRTSFGVDIYKNQQFEYYPRSTSTGFSKNGIAKVQNFGYRDFLWENTLTYDYNPSNDHSFNFLAGATYQRRRQEWNYEEASGFPTDELSYKNMGLASSRDNISSDYFNWSISSVLGRIIYKYKGRYIVNVTARRDGSSRFGSQNRYAFFPSVSGAWRIIDEPFIGLKTRSVISDAKLRVSYGVIGNQEIPYDAIFLRMNPAAYPFNGENQTTGYQVGTTVQGNDELKWESQYQFNAGFDLAVLNSRITATFDFYNKDIRNLLLQIPLPVSQGYDSKWINIAEMNTRGIDIGMKFHIIKTSSFDWQMDVNWSKYVSKVTSLLPGRDSLSPYLKTGEAPNSLIVDYIFDGLYQAGDDFSLNLNARPGDVRVKDLDKNGIINQYDRTIVGRTVPKGWGGIWNYVRYKQISLTVFANYMYGHDISNRAYQDYLYSTDNRRRILKDGLNYWTPTNTNTNIPRPNVFSRSIQTLPAGTSSFIVQKGDFIRVRNITVSYDFTQKLLAKAKISSLRMYAQVLEPFLVTKYKGIDPEISAGSYDTYPRYRTFLFGLQLGL